MYWFARDALDLWSCDGELLDNGPVAPKGYIPFPLAVLGRFGATYAEHAYWVIEGPPEEREPRRVISKAKKPVPAPWQIVSEPEVYRAAGANYGAKYAYNLAVEAYLDAAEAREAEVDGVKPAAGRPCPSCQPTQASPSPLSKL